MRFGHFISMKVIFDDFQAKYNSDALKIRDIPFKDIFGDFSFYLIEESEINSEIDQQISEQIMESQNLIVDTYVLQDNQNYFLINTEQILIIIKSQNISLLKKYFSTQETQEIYFFQNAEENFKKHINIQYNPSNPKYSIFDNTNFTDIAFNIDSMANDEFWKIIKRVMLFNIFSKSYSKTLQNRIDAYLQNAQRPDYTNFDKIENNEIILINPITKLSYYLKTQDLVVLREFQQDEIDNLSTISHPLLPKFYGVTTFEGKKTLVIEYVSGETLEHCMNNHELSEDEDKFDVLMHIMVSIEYLHTKFYAYRNLTPANVIIDHNKTAVLIDFDRTTEFSSCFADPDIQNNKYSFKSDVYSFGMLIYYVLTSNEPKRDGEIDIDDVPKKYSAVGEIIMNCIQKNKDERPDFPHLFCDFYNFCLENSLIHGFSKAIQYFMFAAERQNDEIAQCHLGFIYIDRGSPLYDIDKGIHYLTLAANQNNLYSQNYLGFLYLSGEIVRLNIDEAIHFLSMAANQNQKDAQYVLGCLYFEEAVGHYDIEKAIHFFKEVSHCNNRASNNLGVVYKTGKGADKNLSKSIDYLEDAINQFNDKAAMFNLAHIYFFEDQGKQKLSKSLKLIIEAEKEEIPHAFEFLCLIVLKKFQPLNEMEIEKEFEDIDKSSGESLARRVFRNINNNGFNKEQAHDQLKNINIVYYIHGIDVMELN